MLFKRIEPAENLHSFIECYWIAEDDSTEIREEKIIPDGFTEIIFHYGDPYMIKLDNDWELQPLSLIAGQIDKHFFLRNTGRSGMIAVKFRPAALYKLYGLKMPALTNKVENLAAVCPVMQEFEKKLRKTPHDEMPELLNGYFTGLLKSVPTTETHSERSLELIFSRKGLIAVSELSNLCGISARHLERTFKRQVGLSPKLYSRIIRFNHIFTLIQNKDPEWTALAYASGYYDQAHFINNFKAFTGEYPSAYIFDEQNLANFFLKKGKA